MDFLQQNFALILPLLILQISLIVLGLVNLFKAKRVKCLSIPIWTIIIIFISIIGPILYFVFGRSQE